jgi:SAM-dependent methyltransferase
VQQGNGGSLARSIHDDWDRHWDEYSDAVEENPAQAYRRTVIVSLLGLRSGGEGIRLLDIGSGQGDMALALRTAFPSAQILGLELSRSGVEMSKRKVPNGQFLQRNLLEDVSVPAEQRNWATHAVCSEVIEHVDDPERLLRNARPYMRPDCRLVLTAPGGPMSAFDQHIGHRKHFSSREIDALLRSAGYITEYVGKAGFPFFNLYRCVVILRGKKLIEDISLQRQPSGSWLAATVMRAFHLFFRLNLDNSPWGWQMVAIARSQES